jgi:hypothetical protein
MTISPANQIARLEYVVREQMKEIDRLRTENQSLVDWIKGDSDALTCLAQPHLRPIRSGPLQQRSATSVPR